MIIAYLSIGSNLQCPQRQLRLGIKLIRQLPKTYCLKIAPFYFNPAWGRKMQPQFCNTVVKIATTLSPQYLLSFCQAIETRQGRIRKVKWGARTLDIDILLYGNIRLKTPQLTIPHPYMNERDFVCIPLQALLTNNLQNSSTFRGIPHLRWG